MQILKILGYDVSLNLIDENKIDHGCGIPDKAKKLQGRKLYARKFHLLSLWK